ncbi:MAG: Maf family protein [Phycisphaerales bacterium]
MDEARAMGNVDAIGGAGATSAADSPRAPIWLASASPRRRELLAEAGFDVRVAESDIDDASIPSRGATPAAWCMAMAWFKAARVCELLWRRGALAEAGAPRWLVAADTVCGSRRQGDRQVADADERRRSSAPSPAAYRVVTGVCVLDAGGVHRERREVGGPEPLKSVKSV